MPSRKKPSRVARCSHGYVGEMIGKHCGCAEEDTEKSLRIYTLAEVAKAFRMPLYGQLGSSPREEGTPPIPDYQSIYRQPDSAARRKLQREQDETRRKGIAKRNSGVYGMHGEATGEPELRYEPEQTFSNPNVQAPMRPGQRKPVERGEKLIIRLAAGAPMKTGKRKKKPKRPKFIIGGNR